MSPAAAKPRLPAGMRALAHRNFRLYFAGQAVSILGSWIQQVALAWLVYRLTGSAALLGVTAFCGLIPQLLVGPLAGAWIDKQDKKKWLVGVQALMAVQAFVLAGLTWADWIGTPFIVLMALVLGTLSSFDAPLRQSLIGSFVGSRDDLPNALALNAMLFNAGRFVGPPIAGLLLGTTSEAFCFAINGFSFLALIAGILLVHGTPPPRAKGSMGEVFKEGLQYAWQTWSVRTLILTLIALNLTASTYAVLLPVFARDVFAGDATTLGWLWGAAGCGAFLFDHLPGHPQGGASRGVGHRRRRGDQHGIDARLCADHLAATGAGRHGRPRLRHLGVQCRHQHGVAEHCAGNAARADRLLLHLGPLRLRCAGRAACRFRRLLAGGGVHPVGRRQRLAAVRRLPLYPATAPAGPGRRSPRRFIAWTLK
ncbi:MFS transporter [Dechloromonas sp. ARDL1]|uniref:MFS transporter n=1 Tax=Dechloromonas sp. ARDL1 TaxID=3322121 RepID=UPI003DA7689E